MRSKEKYSIPTNFSQSNLMNKSLFLTYQTSSINLFIKICFLLPSLRKVAMWPRISEKIIILLIGNPFQDLVINEISFVWATSLAKLIDLASILMKIHWAWAKILASLKINLRFIKHNLRRRKPILLIAQPWTADRISLSMKYNLSRNLKISFIPHKTAVYRNEEQVGNRENKENQDYKLKKNGKAEKTQ